MRDPLVVRSVSSPNVGAIGTGFKILPSTRSTPLYLNGVKRRGIAKDVLMASKRLPEFIHISFWPFMAVATAIYKLGRSSINLFKKWALTSNTLSIVIPEMTE